MSGFANARILLVGAGRMGGALLSGWLERGLKPEGVTVVDPAPPVETVRFLERHGLAAVSLDAVRGPFDVALLAVKPQNMSAVLPTLAALTEGALTLSIAAGTPIETFEKLLGPGRAILRAMPNTPAAIGQGMTALYANPRVSPAQKELGEALLSAVGAVAWVEEEAHLDLVTGVSGSGPAYVFLVVECLAAAGEKLGLSRELSMLLARQTVAGAGALLAQSETPASELRENVTSKGGATAAALRVLMDEDRLEDLFADAVAASARRSRELG